MNQRDDLDRMLGAWLDDPQTPQTERILGEVLERTRHIRQRRAWANLERWLPMAVITRPAAVTPLLRIAWILLVGLLLVAFTASVAIVGSRFLLATAAIPQGDEAVFAYGGDDIDTIRADGTNVHQLTTGPGTKSHPAWSPDGTRIAYRLWQDGRDSVVVLDATGTSRTLTTDDQPNEYCTRLWNLAWSPDGTSILFPRSVACDNRYDTFIVAADGSSPATQLLAPGVSSLYATWSPDGTGVAFLGREASGATGLYVADVGPDGARSGGLQGRRIGPDLAPNVAGDLSRVRWSPDGTELAVGSGRTGIFVVKADGSDQRLVAEGDAHNPAWSPDGKRLAFFRTVDPSEYFDGRPCTVGTWVIDADGTDERQLEESGDGCEFEPMWSPDGTRIASMLIASTPDDPDLGFHVGFIMADGSKPTIILETGHAGLGSWQPTVAPLPIAPSSSVAVSPTP